MGEIDTKSIESVQAALSLFGRKNDQRKHRSISITEGKMRSENQELLLTDLANYKVQVEVKEYAYKRALLKLKSYNVTVDELFAQLKNCEAERNQAVEDSKEAREQIDKLESKVKEMSDLLLEAGDAQEQLIHVINELNATKEELRNAKAEISSTEESKVSAKKAVELMAIAVDMEKEKTEELLRCVSEFNDVVLLSKVAAIEAENKPSCTIIASCYITLDYYDTGRKLHGLKTDLEAAEFEIRELKSVAKNAVNRVEQAEKAKTAVEAQLRKWREQKQKRREAAAEESAPKGSNLPKTNVATYNKTHTPYQVINIEELQFLCIMDDHKYTILSLKI
ncbi:hypothetical protein IFM89_034435 [Coptis chinensis]|uniref:Uncharacterized protein n=1 Tax=Coptis chinensis TaxID=261450 RepID=A0A835MK06_9MAGN|nr:hypothetical protein IFM89_034435 [Coptis chinensis]